MAEAPIFDDAFRAGFRTLLAWRRDVRRFRPDPVDEATIEDMLDLACLAPSVGNSQPWRFVRVDDPARRALVRANFECANATALAAQTAAGRPHYARLKLAGLSVAPVQLAVFCDAATGQGHGLGRATMPETLAFSAVTAVHTLWLAARVHGLGVGWISILTPGAMTADMDVPDGWRFVAYLCLGHPVEAHDDPELERAGWQARQTACRQVLRR